MKLVYLVDDDFIILQTVSKWLSLKKYEVRSFSGSVPLYKAMETRLPDIILLDILLKDEDGRNICKDIKQRFHTHITVILYSSLLGSIKEAKVACADDFIDKSAGIQSIIEKLETHIKTEPDKKKEHEV